MNFIGSFRQIFLLFSGFGLDIYIHSGDMIDAFIFIQFAVIYYIGGLLKTFRLYLVECGGTNILYLLK